MRDTSAGGVAAATGGRSGAGSGGSSPGGASNPGGVNNAGGASGAGGIAHVGQVDVQAVHPHLDAWPRARHVPLAIEGNVDFDLALHDHFDDFAHRLPDPGKRREELSLIAGMASRASRVLSCL